MDGWDLTLVMVAGYLALTALVRMMIAHRDQIVSQARDDAESARKKRSGTPESRRAA